MRHSRLLIPLLAMLSAQAPAEPNWQEILGPTHATLPAARAGLEEAVKIPSFQKTAIPSLIHWETDIKKALQLAKSENRPLFVTMRCLPCRSCSDFDKDVLEGGPDLDPLLRQFVTVRLTSAKDINLGLFPMEKFQDLDTSWWGWFLSPEGRIYGVFGGRDASGDAGRTSKRALIATLKRILNHHHDPRRENWNIDGPVPDLASQKPTIPQDLPGYTNWIEKHDRRTHLEKEGCIHCHQVQEILHQGALDAGAFDKKRDLDVWPLPENTGIVLERDDGLLIKSVRPNAPAAMAGLKPGDSLGAAAGRRLFSQADFRAALHRLPRVGPASIDLVYLRNGQVNAAKLDLPDGWRKSNNSWRISHVEGVAGAGPGFWANDATRHRERLGIPKDSMAVTPYFPSDPKWRENSPAWRAGLRGSDTITAVNGQSPNLVGRPWIHWFRMQFEPGDQVTLTVMDQKGAKREITYRPEK
jgi:hypothetical protein